MLGLSSWWPHLQKKHRLPSSGSWKPNSTILTHAKLVGKVLQKTLEQILEQDFIVIHTVWLFNIAMENGPFIDDLPIKHGDFPWLC